MGAQPSLWDGVRLVLFDFDGVVADSEVISLGTLRETLAEFGVPLAAAEVRRRFLGTSLATISARVADESPQRSTEGFGAAWQARLYAEFRASLRPMPHVVDLLDRLTEAGVGYCLASSSTFERIGVALEAMGLSDRLPHVFSSEQVAHGKPAPDLFLHAAEQMGTAPAECLVIEDSPYGVTAAKAAGMRCLGFVGGRHLEGVTETHADTLRAAGADGVLACFQGVGARS